jgi:polysaccharide deacetylase family protein (PEP-CTERM system associated)
MPYTILLTIDVEDWFQVENFKQCIPFSAWPNCELRVEQNVHKILDLLDSIKLDNSKSLSREGASGEGLTSNSKPATYNSSSMSQPPPASRLTPYGKDSLCAMPHAECKTPKATFFVLGWIAKRLPQLIREIQARGHEVASHGYDHILCREQSVEDLKNDLVRSKKLLEDITGTGIDGYRAPGFSINRDILSLIEETGYLYDSSYNSFRLNKRHGQIELRGNNGNDILHKISDSFYEIPISNLRIGKQVFPWGGGGYFRLIPLLLFKQGVERILKQKGAYIFYLHPWEIDSDQPKVSGIQFLYKFRHYININKTLNKLSYLLEKLNTCQYQTCYQYLTERNRSTAVPLHSLTQSPK